MSKTKTGWWGVKFDLALDGEEVMWEDLNMDTQAHILEQINEGYCQGEIVEEGKEYKKSFYTIGEAETYKENIIKGRKMD